MENIQSLVTNVIDKEWFWFLVYAAISAVLSYTITAVVNRAVMRNTRDETGSSIWKGKTLRLPLFILLFLVFNVIARNISQKGSLNIQIDPKIITISTILLAAWLAIRVVKIIRYLIERNYNIHTKDNLKARKVHTQLLIFQRILIFIIITIAVASILITFDTIRQYGISIFASAGVAGIVIGLAAQKMIASFLAGLQIAITQPIRLDDVVIVEGEWGWVEEITLTYVVVKIWDRRRLILPSTYFIEQPFQNWTRNSADILGTVYLYVDYGFPVEALRNELTRLLELSPAWNGEVNVIQVTNTAERHVELRVLVSADTSPKAWDLRVHLREKLLDFISREYPEYLPRTRIEMNREDSAGSRAT